MLIFGEEVLDPFRVKLNAGRNVRIAPGIKKFDHHRSLYGGQYVFGPLRQGIHAFLGDIPPEVCVRDKDIYKNEDQQQNDQSGDGQECFLTTGTSVFPHGRFSFRMPCDSAESHRWQRA